MRPPSTVWANRPARPCCVKGAFSSLAGIAYDRIAHYTGIDPRFRHVVFWPSMTAALFYGRAKYGVRLSSAWPDGRDSSVLPHHVLELSASNPASVAMAAKTWGRWNAGQPTALRREPAPDSTPVVA